MRSLEFLDRAKNSLTDISNYVDESAGPDISLSVVSRILAQCEKLARLSGTLGRARPELESDLRSFPFLGYVIYFRYLPEIFQVVNIAHSARDTGAVFNLKSSKEI